MSIWLGFPEEASGSGTSGTDEVQTIIDEIQTKDQEIDQIQDQIIIELESSDKDLKKIEKEEFVKEAELTSDNKALKDASIEPITVTGSTSWSEIINSYDQLWSTETGEKKDALEDKLFKIRPVMDNGWEYGNPKTPHGKLTVDGKTRISEGHTGNAKTKIDDGAETILSIHEKIRELEKALENERTEMAGSADSIADNTNQDILEAVKSMKAIKINTVTSVVTNDNRWLIEHQIPGRAGVDSEVSASVIQDMGRRPSNLEIKGVLTSDSENRQDLHKKIETLKWFYKQRKPLYFSSRFVNQLDATKVVIERLNFEENQRSPYAVNFSFVLKEYSEIDWKADTDQPPEKLVRHTQHWADFQALTAMLRYRFKFIESNETVTSSEVGKRIANYILGRNGRIKHLATQGVGEEIVPSDLLAPTANLNEAVNFYDVSIGDVVEQQGSGLDGIIGGIGSNIDDVLDSIEEKLHDLTDPIGNKLTIEIENGAEKVIDAIEDGASTVKGWISDGVDETNNVLDKAQNDLNSMLDDVEGKLNDSLKKSQDKLKDVLDRYGIDIPDSKLDDGRKRIEDLIGNGSEKLKEKLSEARDKGGDHVETAKDKLDGLMNKAKDEANSLVNDAKDKLEEAIKKGVISDKEIISKARDALDNALDDLTAKASEALKEAKSKMDDKLKNIDTPLIDAESKTDSKMDEARSEASSSVDSAKESKGGGGAAAHGGAEGARPEAEAPGAAPEAEAPGAEVPTEAEAPPEAAKPEGEIPDEAGKEEEKEGILEKGKEDKKGGKGGKKKGSGLTDKIENKEK